MQVMHNIIDAEITLWKVLNKLLEKLNPWQQYYETVKLLFHFVSLSHNLLSYTLQLSKCFQKKSY